MRGKQLGSNKMKNRVLFPSGAIGDDARNIRQPFRVGVRQVARSGGHGLAGQSCGVWALSAKETFAFCFPGAPLCALESAPDGSPPPSV